jgi:hypothetical protein
MPLRLKKSLYGDQVANLAWDFPQSKWLSSPEIGIAKLPGEGSPDIKRVNDAFITVLNAVDEQLYFATDVQNWVYGSPFKASTSSHGHSFVLSCGYLTTA